MINGIKYNIGSTNAVDLLGYNCEYFYTEQNGEYTLVAIEKAVNVDGTNRVGYMLYVIWI